MNPEQNDNRPDKKPLDQREAAANVLRTQLENIYEGKDSNTPSNIYHRTYKQSRTTNDVNEYHSAWQDYYQKYYEGYYKHYASPSVENATSSDPEPKEVVVPTEEDRIKLIRTDLRAKMRSTGTRFKKSRHFRPIMIAASIFLIVTLMQYNRVIFSNVYAYVAPGAVNPQNIVIDPLTDLSVSQEPRLIIPKINVDVPVTYDIGNDYDSQMAAMSKGLAHFAIPGASAHPGEKGNTAISGHSSNGLFDTGDYKFVFAGLERLSNGDVIYAHYKGTRYTYTITKKETVEPTEVSKLVYSGEKPILTLITCTPLGTDRYRLLVTAEQISPNPDEAKAVSSTVSQNAEIPGNSPTFFQWLIGLFK